jgi:imidazolonepropionase-like amidohydrolase
VRTIEHYLPSEETLALMDGTCLVPTMILAGHAVQATRPPDTGRPAKEMLPRVQHASALAWKMGVTVAAGSDMRYATNDTRQVADEVAELVSAGLPIMDAVKAATSIAAKCLELGNSTGAIKPGLAADLVVLERDPLLDVNALRDVVLVVNDGIVVVDRLAQYSAAWFGDGDLST